jgi:ornithine cyclodeaminase/alanine dehydrogenase-like protein (mu-crystallin family)
MHGDGTAPAPGVLSVHVPGGGFHAKAGVMGLSRNYFVCKTNANFPGNPAKHGLPTIQGAVMVSDADDGRLLALMDSIELTIIRTGAATAVAAKYLANKDSSTVTICGCGNQGRISLQGLATLFPIRKAYAVDVDLDKARAFAKDLSTSLGFEIISTNDLRNAAMQSQICVTCTTSREPILHRGDVSPGCFIAAVGADSETKNEIDPHLIAASKLVVDLAVQSSAFGDLYHAIRQGIVSASHIHAELGEIVAGKKPGRTSPEEIIVFDSTGMALQDVAAAAIVYERAVEAGRGYRFQF